MFQRGERVVYGIHGVCIIQGLEQQRVDRKEVTYLVLEPLSQPGSRYMVPTHSASSMSKVKKIMTCEELEVMMQSEEVRKNCWIQDESRRKQIYRELISSSDREKLMAMVHTLYQHKAEQSAAGRKMHLCDENFLRDVEKQLSGEISVVMELEASQAVQLLRQKLK